MKYNMFDYKGKYFTLFDEEYIPDDMDKADGLVKIGEITEKKLTDEWLLNHIDSCAYYGIPPYLGGNEELYKRIDKLQENTQV